jgi:hypothetical protein
MNIKKNINEGRKSNRVAGVTCILTALAYVLSYVYPESNVGSYILANLELITGGVLSFVTILVMLIKK